MGKVRDMKFGVRIERHACKPKKAKVGQKVRGFRHVTYFNYNFGNSSISLEWVKISVYKKRNIMRIQNTANTSIISSVILGVKQAAEL